MMLPSIFGENLFDDWMDDFPVRGILEGEHNPLYGKHGKNLMKTDVKETDDGYEVDVDLPGFKKDEIHLALDHGYLTISAEKSMEKTRFYNREDLKAKDVARLISIWEGEAGESFTDYCNFSREADKNFLLFLAEKYPILYDYHCKVAGNDWLDHCIQYVE